jgi:hypothetical protein
VPAQEEKPNCEQLFIKIVIALSLYYAHTVRVTKTKTKNEGRKPVNLYLMQETVRQLEMLQKALNRRSKSDTVEVVVKDAAQKAAA